jgi:DNA-binding CsgD family transcriptional regulator
VDLHEAMRGRFTSAGARVEQLRGTVFAGGAAAYLEMFRGDAAAALAAITPSVQAIHRAPDARAAPVRGLHALLAAVVHDDSAPAALVVDAGHGSRYNRGFVQLAEAVIAGGGGDQAAAEVLAARGYRDLEPFPTMAALAAVLSAQRSIADRWGEPASWLSSARGHFQWLGNDVLRRRCDSLLRASGLPVPRRGRGAAEVPRQLRRLGITSREMDVLLLIARQLTNVQIAQRLHLSPRTVETHVSRLLAKAQVSGRAELTALLDTVE